MNMQHNRNLPLLRRGSSFVAFALLAAGAAFSPIERASAQIPIDEPPPVRPRPGRNADGEQTYNVQGVQLPVLTVILPAYEELTGRKLIVDNTITDALTMTMLSQTELTREEAIRFYEDNFLMNGFAVLPVKGQLTDKFVTIANHQGNVLSHSQILREGDEVPDTDDVLIYLMKFKFISADEASRLFTLISGQSAQGGFALAPDGSTMVITASGRVVRSLIEIRDEIDKDSTTLKQEAVQLLRADAEEVEASLNEILTNATSQRQRTGGAGGARAAAGATTTAARAPAVAAASQGEIGALPDANNVHIHAITRTNSVLVIARPIDFAYVKGLIEIFDAPNDIDNFLKRELKYLPVADFLPLAENALLRYQDGANAQGGASRTGGTTGSRTSSRTGGGITNNSRNSTSRSNFGNNGGGGIGGGGSLGSPQELGGPESLLIGNTLLIGDSQLNNVIVSGPPEHLRIIDQLLDEIDIRPRQVYISAVIAQVTLGDDLRYGMDILRTVDDIDIGGESVNIAGLYRTAASSGSTILDVSTLDQVANFPAGAEGFNAWASIGTFLNAYVEALENTSKFQVLSRPFVFTANNQVANIASGERVAVPQSTTSSLNSTDTINSSIGFEEVLLQLEVIPLINSSDEVTLQIAQQNENITGFTVISNNSVPNISTQSLNTTVRLPNRGIVVLGGIIQEDETENINGLPFISKVPLLKHMTGSTSTSKNRRELLIFIQPHIIEGSNDLIDANIDKISRTYVGQSALDVAKPTAKVDPALFPDFKKSRRLLPRLRGEQPMGESEGGNNYYDENALPQHEPPSFPESVPSVNASPADQPSPKRKEEGRKKIRDYFKKEPTPKLQREPADKPRKGLLRRLRD